jgi:signal transduction histidine kinase
VDNKKLIQGENLFHQARTIIADFLQRLVMHEGFDKLIQDDILLNTSQRLITTININELMDIIAQELPKLGIKSCFFSIYINPKKSLEKSQLMLAYSGKKRFDHNEKKIIFNSIEIVPEEIFSIINRFTFIIEPLYFKKEQLGFIVFEEYLKESYFYESLRTQLSVAIKGALLFQEKENLFLNLKNHAKVLQNTMEKLALSNNELEKFSFIVSHDLQEPLRKVSFFASCLKSKYHSSFDKQGKDYLERMESASNRMQNLIYSLLNYSRLTSSPQPFVSINLTEMVQNVLNDLEVLIEKKEAQIEVSNLPVVDGDSVQIQQLFQNLISNGLKFQKNNQKPCVKIYYKLIKKQKENFYEIIIEDNGIGIEQDYYDKIFNVFQRLHGRSEYNGTGIGLAICKKVAERHHWKIRVESKLGKGSKFIVAIPIK